MVQRIELKTKVGRYDANRQWTLLFDDVNGVKSSCRRYPTIQWTFFSVVKRCLALWLYCNYCLLLLGYYYVSLNTLNNVLLYFKLSQKTDRQRVPTEYRIFRNKIWTHFMSIYKHMRTFCALFSVLYTTY